mgnify:CR=1 FL=1
MPAIFHMALGNILQLLDYLGKSLPRATNQGHYVAYSGLILFSVFYHDLEKRIDKFHQQLDGEHLRDYASIQNQDSNRQKILCPLL